MAKYSTPPEAIDDAFVRILIEEMSQTAPLPAEPDGDEPPPAAEELHETAEMTIPLDTVEAPGPPAVPQVREAITPPRDRTSRWQLRIVEEDGLEHRVPLGPTPITLGRSRENSVILRCPRVSRRHLRVWLDAAGPHAEDIGGMNQMRVNGVNMSQSHLQADDVVEIGRVRIHVEKVDLDSALNS